MPKPIKEDNGSGMHTHMSIWKGGKPLFAGNGYAGLSRHVPLFHRRRHQARQGAQRLHQPDHQQLQAAGAGLRSAGAARLFGRNRSASCRIPYGAGAKAKRVEFRFPDAMANPVSRLCGAADGRPRRHPEQDPSGRGDGQEPLRPAAGTSWPRCRPSAARCARRSTASRPTTTSCSRATCSAKDQIEAYIELKWAEVARWEMTPSPVEFDMYYSA